MSEKPSGCIGCLGSLVVLTLLGSVFFGGGVLMRIGSMGLSFGNPVDRNQIIADYLNELENKATVADEAVKTFHSQLNQGKCEEIYEQAHEILKSTTTLLNMISLCREIKSKLGSVESTNRFSQPEQLKPISDQDYWVIPKPSFQRFTQRFSSIPQLSWFSVIIIALLTLSLVLIGSFFLLLIISPFLPNTVRLSPPAPNFGGARFVKVPQDWGI